MGTVTEPLEPQDALRMRATDAERARAASAVDAAVADGRLTWTEHAERYGQIWAAQTRGELLPPLADLGGTIEIPQTQRVVVAFSKVQRAVAGSTQEVFAKATFGAIVLDLTALRPGNQLLVHASSFCGKILIMVPDDATVIDRGEVFLGKRAALRTSPPPGGPVIRIDGRSSLGNLKVRRASDDHGLEHLLGQVGPVRHLHIHHDRHLHLHGQHDPRRRRKQRKWDGYDGYNGYW